MTNETYKINHQFECNKKCLVYLLTCKKCLKQYVGQTIDTFRHSWHNYKSNDRKFQRSEPCMQEHLFQQLLFYCYYCFCYCSRSCFHLPCVVCSCFYFNYCCHCCCCQYVFYLCYNGLCCTAWVYHGYVLVHVYVYMYVCKCVVYVYICVYVCMYVYIYDIHDIYDIHIYIYILLLLLVFLCIFAVIVVIITTYHFHFIEHLLSDLNTILIYLNCLYLYEISINEI